ncbi:MAG: spore coat associated protein CotJA [Clostridiales bacterium]|nr:spore coat associated protein CotJA [Clostridiales bacterium]
MINLQTDGCTPDYNMRRRNQDSACMPCSRRNPGRANPCRNPFTPGAGNMPQGRGMNPPYNMMTRNVPQRTMNMTDDHHECPENSKSDEKRSCQCPVEKTCRDCRKQDSCQDCQCSSERSCHGCKNTDSGQECSCPSEKTCRSCGAEISYHWEKDSLHGMPLAMAYVPWQTWQNICDLDKALSIGTIFQDLYYPWEVGRCSGK